MKTKFNVIKRFKLIVNNKSYYNFCSIDKFINKNKSSNVTNESSFQSAFPKSVVRESIKNSFSVQEITEKYIFDHLNLNNFDSVNSENKEKIRKFVKNLAKEEIFTSTETNQSRKLAKLKIFIENCIRYNKCNYLDSEYFFNNKNYSFLLDSAILEKEYQNLNPYSNLNVIQENLKLSSEYDKILASYKSMESIPQEIQEKTKESFLNFFNFITSSVQFNKEKMLKQSIEKNLKLIDSAKNEKILTNIDSDYLQIPENYKKILNFKKLLMEQDVFKQHFAEGKIQEVIDNLLVSDSIYLKNYPGSIKGKNPEDDPEHFINWFEKNHPKAVVNAFNRLISKNDNKDSLIKNKNSFDNENEEKEEIKEDEDKELDQEEFNNIDMDNEMDNEKIDDATKTRIEFNRIKSEFQPIKNQYVADNAYHFDNDGFDDISGATVQEEDVDEDLDEELDMIYNPVTDYETAISPLPPKTPFMFMNFFKSMCEWNEVTDNLIDENSLIENLVKDQPKNEFNNYADSVNIYNDGIKYKDAVSMKSLIKIYPDLVQDNINIRNIIQVLDRHCTRKYTVDQKQFILDFFAYTILPFSKKSQKYVDEYLVEGSRSLPRTMKNFKKFNAVNWKKVERRVVKEKYPDDIDSETTDEELRVIIGGFVDNGIDAELEEMERQEEKKKAEKEKRDAEEAKNLGKEAFEAYKKKIEDERKLKEKEEEEREEKEIEKENLQAQKEEDGLVELNFNEQLELEDDTNKEEEDTDEVLDEKGRVIFGHDELDRYSNITPNEYVGKELKKKYLVLGGLPKLERNHILTNSDQIRFVELYDKMQKLKISKDEEEEFLKTLELRITDPEKFSKISGIPVSEITFSTEKAKNIAENLFKDVSKVNLTENELRIMYGDNISMDSNEIDNTLDVKKLEESASKFYFKPLEDPYVPANPNLNPIPIDFYDNDDGFWDSYKLEKLRRFDFGNVNNAPFHTLKDNLVRRRTDENDLRV